MLLPFIIITKTRYLYDCPCVSPKENRNRSIVIRLSWEQVTIKQKKYSAKLSSVRLVWCSLCKKTTYLSLILKVFICVL